MLFFQQITKKKKFYSFICDYTIDEKKISDSTTAKISHGRTKIKEIVINNINCIIREYTRGGLFGKILKNRYLNARRFLDEFLILKNLTDNNFPTTKPAFLYFRKYGIFNCGAIATFKIENQINLIELLNQASLKIEILEKLILDIFDKIKLLDNLNIYHPDIHLKNILVSTDNKKIYIIDFDKAANIKYFKKYFVYAMFFRFMRSINKHKKKYTILEKLEIKKTAKNFLDKNYPIKKLSDKIQCLIASLRY